MFSVRGTGPNADGGDGDRALTPILAATLLVAVIVVMGTTVTSFVLVLTDQLSEPAPTATFEAEQTDRGTLLLRHTAGDTIDGDTIEVTDGEVTAPETVDAGSVIKIEPTDETVDVVWNAKSSGSTQLLGTETATRYPLLATGASQNWKTNGRVEYGYYSASVRGMDVTDDQLYMGVNKELWGRDRASGSMRWTYDAPGLSSLQAVEESDGVVYGGTHYAELWDSFGYLFALDADDGSELWVHDEHRKYEGDIVDIYESGGIVYSIDDENVLIATDAEDGSVLWTERYQYDLGGGLDGSDGVLYAGHYAIDASDGSVIWGPESYQYDYIRDIDVNDGVVYRARGSYSGFQGVVAVDADDGTEIWRHDHQGETVYAVDARAGVIYSGGGGGKVVAADASNGSKLWSHDYHDENIKAVQPYNGIVYSGDGDADVVSATLTYDDSE